MECLWWYPVVILWISSTPIIDWGWKNVKWKFQFLTCEHMSWLLSELNSPFNNVSHGAREQDPCHCALDHNPALDIAIYTGISQHTVEWILHFFKVHGTIDHKEEECKRRCRYLHDLDVEVCEWQLLTNSLTLLCTVSVRSSQADPRFVLGWASRDACSLLQSDSLAFNSVVDAL